MEPWIVSSPPSERYSLWTRANVGEVFPDPVAPLTFSLMMRGAAEPGWRDALVTMGAFTPDEFSPDEMEPLGVFGGYCYLNASITRILGERGPGMSAQMMDDLFFGAMPGIPPYVEAPGDHNPERSAAIEQTFNWVMTTTHIEAPTASAKVADRLREERPNLDAMSNNELWTYARDLLLTHFRQLFMEHIYISFLSPLPVGALTQICAAVGRPDDAMRALSGVGDVESAAPSLAMWDLGRTVAADPALTAAFDAGVPGLVERLRGAGPSGKAFLARFDDFLRAFGSRGPNEWEMRNHTWETKPELALAAIDRMRFAGTEAAPQMRAKQMAADRERVVSEISALLKDDPETRGMFEAAASAAVLFQAGRERTKTNAVKLIQEARMALHTIGRRLVAEGRADDVSDFGLVLAPEMEAWLADPASLRNEIRRRRELFGVYASLQEPFVFAGRQPDPTTWARAAKRPSRRSP